MAKTFYIGLILVIIGVSAGTLLVQRGIGAINQHVAISNSESEALGLNCLIHPERCIPGWDEGGDPIRMCFKFLCEQDTCTYNGTPVANRGDEYRYYPPGNPQSYENPPIPSKVDQLLRGIGFGDGQKSVKCPSGLANLKCSPVDKGISSNKDKQKLAQAFADAIGNYSGDQNGPLICFKDHSKEKPGERPEPSSSPSPKPTYDPDRRHWPGKDRFDVPRPGRGCFNAIDDTHTACTHTVQPGGPVDGDQAGCDVSWNNTCGGRGSGHFECAFYNGLWHCAQTY